MARGPVPKRQRKSLVPPLESSQPALPSNVEWHAETVEWWAALARSPEASEFSALDWLQLRLVARLMDQFVREPSRQLLAELRLQFAKFGLSPEDRARLRWEAKALESDEQAGPTSSPSRQRSDPRKEPAR